MYRGAMRAMLSELARQDRLVVIDSLELEAPKTKLLVGEARASSGSSNVLVADRGATTRSSISPSRNLPDVDVLAGVAPSTR